jgi:hypothetical protein
MAQQQSRSQAQEDIDNLHPVSSYVWNTLSHIVHDLYALSVPFLEAGRGRVRGIRTNVSLYVSGLRDLAPKALDIWERAFYRSQMFRLLDIEGAPQIHQKLYDWTEVALWGLEVANRIEALPSNSEDIEVNMDAFEALLYDSVSVYTPRLVDPWSTYPTSQLLYCGALVMQKGSKTIYSWSFRTSTLDDFKNELRVMGFLHHTALTLATLCIDRGVSDVVMHSVLPRGRLVLSSPVEKVPVPRAKPSSVRSSSGGGRR